jgi:thioredoxin reductase
LRVSSFVDVAIIGAGPYGLSVAAHLNALGVDYRIFGKPMQLWREHMPPGMRLKSDGASSDVVDAADELTLKKYCAAHGIDHHDTHIPVRLDTFVAYGMEFQQRFVPQLEQKFLTTMERAANGFILRFDENDVVIARRVVLAIGVAAFKFMPEFLQGLPEEHVSHASRWGAFDALDGKQVTVMGAGASAIDIAGLLGDRGTDVSVMTRRETIEFHAPPGYRSLKTRLRAPNTGIGSGWRLRVFHDQPLAFHVLSESVRLKQVSTLLGPSTGWFMKNSIVGKVPLLTGLTPHRAEIHDGRLHIKATDQFNVAKTIVTDHLVAGTGYKVDLRKLGFLPEALRTQIKHVNDAPILNTRFQTSVNDLYVVGPASMNSFGPLMRFVHGARYTAHRVAPALAASLLRGRATAPVPHAHSVTG